MATGVTITKNGIAKLHKQLLDKSKMPLAIAAREIVPTYINAQVKRWESENTTETGQWDRLDKSYEAYKKVKYAAYPEQGGRMLVATGDMLKAVTLQGGVVNHGAYLPEPGTFHVQIISPYASYVNELRDFSTFGHDTIEKIKKIVAKDYFGVG